jgi:hypothetical protein
MCPRQGCDGWAQPFQSELIRVGYTRTNPITDPVGKFTGHGRLGEKYRSGTSNQSVDGKRGEHKDSAL